MPKEPLVRTEKDYLRTQNNTIQQQEELRKAQLSRRAWSPTFTSGLAKETNGKERISRGQSQWKWSILDRRVIPREYNPATPQLPGMEPSECHPAEFRIATDQCLFPFFHFLRLLYPSPNI